MSSQAELAASLDALAAQAEKAHDEIVTKIAALEDALANAGSTSPEVDAALEALKAQVQGLDDIEPDAPAA
jgi:hypothetical protein